jgi:tight adherence protein C
MSVEMMLTLAAVFLSVALATGSIATLVFSNTALSRRRLQAIAGRPGEGAALATQGGLLTEAVTPAAARIKRFIPKSPKEMSRVRKKMALAGYHSLMPALIFTASELLVPVILGGLAFVFAPAGIGIGRLMLAAFAGAVGYIMPGLVLQYLIAQRKKIIQNGLPDALDLFIVCIEAGSSLDQAILKTSQDLDVPYPPLAEELRMITIEMRAGKPRLEAFKNFAARTGVDDVRALVSMLTQADKFGTSIAQALRTHAEVARTKRRQRAEERAAKIGVKLVFPLVFCLFPAFYVVTLGPGAVQFIRFFSQDLGR